MSRSVEIAIVNWNGRADTLRALESIREDAASAKITVVDNGSTDGSVEAIKRQHPETRIVRLHTNRGFTGGVAAAADACDAEFLILLNNDAEVERGWYEALTAAIVEAPSDVIAVSGKIVDPTATRVDFVGGAMTFDGHAFQVGFRKPLAEVDEPAPGAELLFACGGNMIVRRREFQQLGGFDDDYFAYLEDVDFGWRSWIAGYRVVFEPLAVARHKSSATSDRLGNFERGVLFERNALQTAVKNFSDASFAASMAPALLALLHRLHRYVIDRNGDTSNLTRPPVGAPAQTNQGLRRRLANIIGKRATTIDDPLTEMQFRAVEWFFANSEKVMVKRSVVQKLRKRSDEEIFTKFPLHYVPTYHGDASLMSSSLFRALRRELSSVDSSLEAIMRS